METSMWCMCVLCGFLPVNNGRSFATGIWIEHKDSASHNRKVEHNEHMENIKAARWTSQWKRASLSENYVKDTGGHW